ncbi:MAG: class GN sortase [Alphaproteobacteria bacterium]|nr:class GN sortase [Alphaproteobacteria bacterium]
MVLALAVLLIAGSAIPFAGAGWIHAKAVLAQILLERSWQARLAGTDADAAKPWPWADTAPIARLQVPRLEVDQVVLAGASGRSLAFGPGHLTGTALPGERGNSVITGHRDTHFDFIGELKTGDIFRLQRPDGSWARYRVAGGEVVDARTAQLDATPDRSAVTLVTCYPFNSRDYNQPWRYAVFGEEIVEG